MCLHERISMCLHELSLNSRQQALLARCKDMVAEEYDLEDVLAFLRQNGFSKAESIQAIMMLQNKPLREAQVQVHLSKTWKDTRERDEALQDHFWQVL